MSVLYLWHYHGIGLEKMGHTPKIQSRQLVPQPRFKFGSLWTCRNADSEKNACISMWPNLHEVAKWKMNNFCVSLIYELHKFYHIVKIKNPTYQWQTHSLNVYQEVLRNDQQCLVMQQHLLSASHLEGILLPCLGDKNFSVLPALISQDVCLHKTHLPPEKMFLAQQKLFAQHNKPQDSMMKCHWRVTKNEHHLNPKPILFEIQPRWLESKQQQKTVDNILVNRNVYIPSKWRSHSKNILRIYENKSRNITLNDNK